MLASSNALISSGLLFAEEAKLAGFDNPANVILVASTTVIVALIVTVAALSRSKISSVPTGMGVVFEMVYDFVMDMAVSMMGPVGKRFVPFCMSLFLFVLICNWSGLLPSPSLYALGHNGESEPLFECPTTQFSTTFAMAAVSFVAIIFFGVRKYMFGAQEKAVQEEAKKNGEDAHMSHGDGIMGIFTWWLHFLHPTPMLWRDMQGIMRYLLVPVLGCLFVVLNIIEEVARLVSLSIRLYGNLNGEHVVKSNLLATMQTFLHQAGDGGAVALVGYGIMSLLMWGCSFFVTCIGTLAGFIQAYVFFVLTLSYISHVATDEH